MRAGLPMLAALSSALALPAASAVAGDDPLSSLYVVPDGHTRMALRDVDGDGDLDLLMIGLHGVSLRRLGPDGRYPDADEGSFPWPSGTVGWNLADLDADGDTEVVLLVDGRRVVALEPTETGALLPGPTLVEAEKGFLPRGIRRVNFVRDVDGDERPDLVVPSTDRFLISINAGPDADTPFADPIPVGFQASIELLMGDPERIDRRFGQDVQIPWFTLEDVNGDGTVDLVSQTPDEAQFHIAEPGLPVAPTWSLDVAALKAEIPPPSKIDLDNLLANVDPQVNWRVADLDGEAPWDLVVQQAGKVSVYLGGSLGPDLDLPDQVLKASGNVLYFLLRDVTGDRLPDLQLLRADTISLGDALRLLIVPGSLDFDVFTYNNTGGGFARKPSVRTTLALRIPALLGFLDDVEEMRDDYEARVQVPAEPAVLDADGVLDDVMDLGGGELQIWKNVAPGGFGESVIQRISGFDVDELLEEYAIQRLDDLADGGTVSIELKDIEKLLVAPGWDLRNRVLGRKPDEQYTLAFPSAGASLRAEDLDGDGRDDAIVTGTDRDGRRLVQFLLLR